MSAMEDEVNLALVWDTGPFSGQLEAFHGQLGAVRLAAGTGTVSSERVEVTSAGPVRLELSVKHARVAPGAHPTLLQLKLEKSPVTLFLRDVTGSAPIFIPEYGLAVTSAQDARTYTQIAEAVRAKGLVSELQRIAQDPEETFAQAAAHNRNMPCPVWLGLGRDMRIFRFLPAMEEAGYWGLIEPYFHSQPVTLPETKRLPYRLRFCLGRGSACRVDIARRLEDGVLPILRSTQADAGVAYHLTAFATLETRPLSPGAVLGTDGQVAYLNTGGHMTSPEDQEKLKDALAAATGGRDEQAVCCVRVEAINSGRVPRYAWFKGLYLTGEHAPPSDKSARACGFAGLGDRVMGLQRLNGQPMPDEEMAVLLQPGATAIWELLVPHQPISRARAEQLARLDFDAHLAACRHYWREKLRAGAQIGVPEAAIDERIRAGLLHLDLNCLGQEPDGQVLPCVGWYAPIGSESAPIIQFFDSVGWHRLAERALDFFFDRQRADGFIQNFGGYQLETGPVLWSAGEHYRYTRDEAWLRRVKPKLLKSCDCLLQWRERNKTEAWRGKGYGLLEGKVADPDDFFHSFMLNGLSYVGLRRVAEMLEQADPAAAARLAQAAAEFKQDIRASYYEALARSPVVPLGDGTWAPAPPPWAEHRGPVALYAEGGAWFSHGMFACRDSLIGPLYLVLGEVLEPEELGATFLLKTHQELMTVENAGLSQPYYCRHDYLHLKRGEVKAFLKTYYNQVTALQDRETYTFWEHYHHASQHKTHEEGWFLMQTRWMLFLEEGGTLAFLRAIPRRWLEDGKKIELRNVATYFGPASLRVESKLNDHLIEASVECPSERRPREITVRLPHPEGRKARAVTGGLYDPAAETVRISDFGGSARIALRF